jgi:hypothetical protein
MARTLPSRSAGYYRQGPRLAPDSRCPCASETGILIVSTVAHPKTEPPSDAIDAARRRR